jgi:hypothetical protein
MEKVQIEIDSDLKKTFIVKPIKDLGHVDNHLPSQREVLTVLIEKYINDDVTISKQEIVDIRKRWKNKRTR